jgi:hypothetical protein
MYAMNMRLKLVSLSLVAVVVALTALNVATAPTGRTMAVVSSGTRTGVDASDSTVGTGQKMALNDELLVYPRGYDKNTGTFRVTIDSMSMAGHDGHGRDWCAPMFVCFDKNGKWTGTYTAASSKQYSLICNKVSDWNTDQTNKWYVPSKLCWGPVTAGGSTDFLSPQLPDQPAVVYCNADWWNYERLIS